MIFTTKRFDDVTTLGSDDLICYCCEVDKETIQKAIEAGAKDLAAIKKQTGACTGSACKEKNPNGRCCAKEIRALIALHEGS